MIIPIPISFKYKVFPFSTKATNLSRALGVFTSFIACILYAFFWFAVIGSVLTNLGIPEDVSYGIAAVSLILLFFIIRAIKSAANKKITEVALADLYKLREIDPQAFFNYVNMLNSEK